VCHLSYIVSCQSFVECWIRCCFFYKVRCLLRFLTIFSSIFFRWRLRTSEHEQQYRQQSGFIVRKRSSHVGTLKNWISSCLPGKAVFSLRAKYTPLLMHCAQLKQHLTLPIIAAQERVCWSLKQLSACQGSSSMHKRSSDIMELAECNPWAVQHEKD
jgi:hypothetical protein